MLFAMASRKPPSDTRPPVAIGHVEHRVADVPQAAAWYESLGVRRIFRQRTFAVMEVRGGTHIILAGAKNKIPAGTPAPFDFIVDDVDATRAECLKKGMKPGRMKRGTIHDSFELTDPSGYVLTIFSSHASGRPV
jgi:catechol-2,3-dioxygenase